MFLSMTLLIALDPLTAAFAVDAKPSAAELLGTWRLVSVEAAAGAVELPDARPLLTVAADRLMFGGDEFARLTADQATQPKIFDLNVTTPERTYEGIYRMQGRDGFQVCLNGRTEGVKERPSTFSLDDQPIRRLLTFERAKPDEPPTGAGFIGMALQTDEETGGIKVQGVLDGSPAQKAGLRKEDAVLGIGGDAVTDLRSAVNAVRRGKPRTELAVRIRRDGKEIELKVRVGVIPLTVLTGLD